MTSMIVYMLSTEREQPKKRFVDRLLEDEIGKQFVDSFYGKGVIQEDIEEAYKKAMLLGLQDPLSLPDKHKAEILEGWKGIIEDVAAIRNFSYGLPPNIFE